MNYRLEMAASIDENDGIEMCGETRERTKKKKEWKGEIDRVR